MKILVTGGAGFIGSHLARELLRNGHSVVVVDNLSRGRRRNVPFGARFYRADVRDASAMGAVFARERPDMVCHLAAQVEVLSSMTDPANDAEVNVLGTIRVLEMAVRYGVRKVVYTSTVAVYGEPSYLPVDERHPLCPLSPYGLSKRIGEEYLQWYGSVHGLPFTILRLGNVYGPGQETSDEGRVVVAFASEMLNGGRPVIFGDGGQERDFIYVKDVVEAIILSFEHGDGEVCNIGSGKAITVQELYRRLAALTGYRGPEHYAPPRPGDIYRIRLNPARARKALGWEPHTPLEEGLMATVRWMAARYTEKGGKA